MGTRLSLSRPREAVSKCIELRFDAGPAERRERPDVHPRSRPFSADSLNVVRAFRRRDWSIPNLANQPACQWTGATRRDSYCRSVGRITRSMDRRTSAIPGIKTRDAAADYAPQVSDSQTFQPIAEPPVSIVIVRPSSARYKGAETNRRILEHGPGRGDQGRLQTVG